MKIVDLFSGVGGFSYAAEQIVGGFETVAFVERDEYCQKVLRKHWKDVPIYNDIRSFNGKDYKDADIVVGGFPCQPWSVAGAQKGSEDDRDLWHEMVRIIEDIRPRWVIGENVSGFVTMPMGLRRSLSDLESIGYKAIPYLIPAAAVDAKHRRMRCWVVGYTEHDGSSTTSFRRRDSQADGGSTQRQNQTSELERAGGRTDNEFVQTDIFDLMADTDNAGDRTPASGIDTEQQTLEQGRADISQSEPSRQCEDVPNTESKRLEGRIHSATISAERNESTHTGDICSRERNNVAYTNNQGVRTRINGSDNDLPKESRSGGDERTTSTGDVGLHIKTTKNGGMGLSKERNPAFRERPILWDAEPSVGRVANGVPNRVHRLRCLGNSIVPQVVARIFYAIKEAENAKEM
jgi:DNA-cytosine methyltransferase